MSAAVDLRPIIERAAAGDFPPVDGGWERAQPWSPHFEGVVAMTGHAYLAVRDDPPAAVSHRVDGLGGAHDPRVVAALAGPDGWIEALDVVLVRRSPKRAGEHTIDRPVRLMERPDLMNHPRARFASSIRQDVRALGLEDPTCTSVVTVGRGLAGLPEIGIELDPPPQADGPHGDGRSHVMGAELLEAALRDLDEPLVVACVAPGNARALRMFWACGFVAVGSVQLFSRTPVPTHGP